MTVRRHWQFPEGIFTGVDWTPERRAMEDLSKSLNFPLVGLRRETVLAIGAGGITIPFPITLADESGLYRSGTNTIQVPQDYSHYLVMGVVGVFTDGAAGVGRRVVEWQLNAAATPFRLAITAGSAGPNVTLCVPIMKWVKKGDFLRILIASTAGAEDLTSAEVWAMFVPVN